MFFVVCTVFKIPMKNFSVSQDSQGVYHLEGELSIHALDELKAFLEGSVKDAQEISVSFARVIFIDTAALQLLIAFKRRIEPEVKFKISAVSAEVEDILSLCGLKSALM
jgi:anti-anti-sigma factor